MASSASYKQDLPPKGGYAPINFRRIPARQVGILQKHFCLKLVLQNLLLRFWMPPSSSPASLAPWQSVTGFTRGGCAHGRHGWVQIRKVPSQIWLNSCFAANRVQVCHSGPHPHDAGREGSRVPEAVQEVLDLWQHFDSTNKPQESWCRSQADGKRRGLGGWDLVWSPNLQGEQHSNSQAIHWVGYMQLIWPF